jgi:hypothetical protein
MVQRLSASFQFRSGIVLTGAGWIHLFQSKKSRFTVAPQF